MTRRLDKRRPDRRAPDRSQSPPRPSDTAGVPAEAPHEQSPSAGDPDDLKGATEEQIGDRTGPGVGYDQEPQKEKDEGGVS